MGENQKQTTDAYRKNWDSIFGKKKEVLVEEEVKESNDDG